MALSVPTGDAGLFAALHNTDYAMADLSMSRSAPAVRRHDYVERSQRFSEFLAVLESRTVGGSKLSALETAVAAAVERLVPIRGARLTTAPEPPLAAREGPAALSLRFPVPSVPRSDLALEVDVDPSFALNTGDRQALRQAARVVGLVIASRSPAPAGQPPEPTAPLIGSSGPMRRLRQQIERVAVTDFTILIEGECGSGKELVARQVHELSRRRRGPFIAVNCAALVETLLEAELFGIEDRVATGVRARRGKFELADQGTLFLDEVADLSPAAQAKLLRAIQELSVERVGGNGARAVDIRIVVATNQRLHGLVQTGRFRTDLYYRLAGVELNVPPLRQRRDDIVELTGHFLTRHHGLRRLTLSQSAADALRSHDWPGNVRELQRIVERALALATSDVIGLPDLPIELTRGYAEVLQPSVARAESMRTWGSRYARLMLERCGHNKRRTCEVLGISYHTLQSYLRHAAGAAPAAAQAVEGRPARAGRGSGGTAA